jgi:hypothetical protein
MAGSSSATQEEESQLVYDPLSESPVKRWLLLDGHRLHIAGLLAGAVFGAVVALQATGVLRPRDPTAVVRLPAALVGGTLPFITIVLAINQLVLSQELGWTAGLRERLDGMTSLRREVERLTGATVAPASPADFLKCIVGATADRNESLEAALASDADPRTVAAVERFQEALAAESGPVVAALDDAKFGTFDTLASILGHYQGGHLHAVRHLLQERPEDFADTGPLEDLVELLEALAVARQTFKTLYVQHELAVLSRQLLYVGFPTLVGGGLLVVGYPAAAEALGPTWLLVALASTSITLVFLPFVVLLSYSLRIATIAARTADFGPFVPGA